MTRRIDLPLNELAEKYVAGSTCDELAVAHGVNRITIYNRLKEMGIPRRKPGSKVHGPEHWNWKGGRSVDEKGYVRVRLYPNDPYHGVADKNGKAKEHRYIMSKHLGRCLEPFEEVHHINGDRADNRLENLQLRSGPHGSGSVFKCADCGSHNLEAVEL